MTNMIAATGVLKAAARPAEAPINVALLLCRGAAPNRPFKFDETLLPMYTDGPSRQRLLPPPMLRIPAKNFTIPALMCMWPSSFQYAVLISGIPLPTASLLNPCTK